MKMTKKAALHVMNGYGWFGRCPEGYTTDDFYEACRVAAAALRRSMKATRAAKKSAIAKRKNGKKENAR